MQGERLSSFGIGGLVSPLQIENCALLGSISMHREASPTNPCILFQASQRCALFLLPPVSTERKDPFLNFSCIGGCKFPSSRFSQDYLQTSRGLGSITSPLWKSSSWLQLDKLLMAIPTASPWAIQAASWRVQGLAADSSTTQIWP